MSGVIALAAIAVFLGGFAVGVVLAVGYVVRREDRYYSLTGKACDPLIRGARRLTGVARPDSGDLLH